MPRLTTVTPDWQAASQTAGDIGFDGLNAKAEPQFPGIAKASVPVLLPFDKDVLAGFQSTSFFQTGPGGYDAGFALRTSDVSELSDIRYNEPVYVLLSGLRFTYDLDGPALPQGQPVKELDELYPGITRTLHESYIRYSFVRYGVTYVTAIYCRDTRPRPKLLACKQADRVAIRFLRALKLAGGGAQAATPTPPVAAERPEKVSPDFAYHSAGSLIPRTGRTPDTPGRADETVYVQLRFPFKDAPAFANSQSFNNWGDCDFTGRSPRRLGKKGMAYSCNVNGRPLVFDESAGANYSYPWRDNFCEHRNFMVGQCPAGEGHQGQDIRPKNCALFNQGADRCEPYRDEIVAAHDGMILRARKQEAVYLFVNTADTHLRVRYMHMSPKLLDDDGILSGKTVKAGDRLGLLAGYNEHERGTTYHLHFDMQVPTRVGYVFVNPYMSLVTSFERLLGARGTEIKDGDTVPPLATVPAVILRPDVATATVVAPAGTETPATIRLPDEKPPQTVAPPAPEPQHTATTKDKPRKTTRHAPRRNRHAASADAGLPANAQAFPADRQ